jgi:hypothetical protein
VLEMMDEEDFRWPRYVIHRELTHPSLYWRLCGLLDVARTSESGRTAHRRWSLPADPGGLGVQLVEGLISWMHV